jgi:CBS domain-containing protein
MEGQVRTGGGTSREEESSRVSSIMTPNVVRIPKCMSARAVMAMFLELGISGAPVVDDDGKSLGMLTKTDLLQCVRARWECGRPLPEEVDEVGQGSEDPCTAESLMTPLVFSLPEDAPVACAAGLMATEGIHRVLVLDGDGTISGIVTSVDVARWLAEKEGFLRPRPGPPGRYR